MSEFAVIYTEVFLFEKDLFSDKNTHVTQFYKLLIEVIQTNQNVFKIEALGYCNLYFFKNVVN